MVTPLREVARETIVRVRDDYAAGKSVRDILNETGLSTTILYKIIDGRYEGFPPLQRRGLAAPGSPGARAALVSRLWNAADRQVRDIEKRLRGGRQQPDERERDARLLATMVKTLRELRALDAMQAEQEPTSEDEYVPDNLDDFRRELARKIDAIVAERDRSPAGGSQG